jgi:hypothetical protein
MGGSWYIRASKDALFEIPKPLRTKGMGVDALPMGIRESEVLTGNNLGRLGNMEQLPSKQDVMDISQDPEVKTLSKIELHHLAQRILEKGNAQKAMSILLHAETL